MVKFIQITEVTRLRIRNNNIKQKALNFNLATEAFLRVKNKTSMGINSSIIAIMFFEIAVVIISLN
ncbi:hypothetical protein [Pseudobacteroides cellulosolvens]|uniref:hypothetical protein n=1 Tax=Pseudobacteroides cellulosolvens TaxID=35825 RepID=UPI001FA7CFB7|nr:hypothetical protein [Pseudobacteroides cellulosolvens]